jgi:hypothetical protein
VRTISDFKGRYCILAEAHCGETLGAETATTAAVQLRRKLGCDRGDLEIVAMV